MALDEMSGKRFRRFRTAPFSMSPQQSGIEEMNRKQRRLIKSNAPTVAAQMAGQAYDYTPAGRLMRVTHPVAVAALTRAFQHMLANGCEAHTTRLSSTTAEAFPRGAPTPAGATSYLAVGLDPDGRGTYSIRSIMTPGAPANLADLLNRRAALLHLQELTKTRGFPMGEPEGRA